MTARGPLMPWLRRWFSRYGLPAWFIALSTAILMYHAAAGRLGIDSRLYRDASVAWLAGGNPWDTFVLNGDLTFHYAGLPPTVLAFVPLTALDPQVVAIGSVVASVCAAVFIVWRLHLPWFWLLFPPLVEGAFVGNPHVVLLALLLTPLAWMAPLVKVYLIVPLVAEVRLWQMVLVGGGFALSVVAVPSLWRTYVDDFGSISSRLLVEASGGWSAYRFAPLFAVTVIAIAWLARRDLMTAGWLAVPGLWPASQFFYGSMLLPVATPFLAFFLAIPVPGAAPTGIVCYVLLRYGPRPLRLLGNDATIAQPAGSATAQP